MRQVGFSCAAFVGLLRACLLAELTFASPPDNTVGSRRRQHDRTDTQKGYVGGHCCHKISLAGGGLAGVPKVTGREAQMLS
jgi:hypothetical protein